MPNQIFQSHPHFVLDPELTTYCLDIRSRVAFLIAEHGGRVVQESLQGHFVVTYTEPTNTLCATYVTPSYIFAAIDLDRIPRDCFHRPGRALAGCRFLIAPRDNLNDNGERRLQELLSQLGAQVLLPGMPVCPWEPTHILVGDKCPAAAALVASMPASTQPPLGLLHASEESQTPTDERPPSLNRVPLVSMPWLTSVSLADMYADELDPSKTYGADDVTRRVFNRWFAGECVLHGPLSMSWGQPL